MVSALHIHLVFATKYRHGVLDDAMPRCCQTAIRKACRDFKAEPRQFNGETGHVHLLVHYPPKVSMPALMNSFKGISARRTRSEFTGRVNRARTNGHFWSPSYFAASCGGAPLSIIRQYTEQQQRPRLTAGPRLTPP